MYISPLSAEFWSEVDTSSRILRYLATDGLTIRTDSTPASNDVIEFRMYENDQIVSEVTIQFSETEFKLTLWECTSQDGDDLPGVKDIISQNPEVEWEFRMNTTQFSIKCAGKIVFSCSGFGDSVVNQVEFLNSDTATDFYLATIGGKSFKKPYIMNFERLCY